MKLSLLLFVGSVAFTIAMWLLHVPFFFLFLFVPLIPFFGRKRAVRRCPVCGWETTGSERFCPWDAAPLAGPGSEGGEREQ